VLGSRSRDRFFVPVSANAPGRWNARVASFLPRSVHVLHGRTPPWAVAELCRLIDKDEIEGNIAMEETLLDLLRGSGDARLACLGSENRLRAFARDLKAVRRLLDTFLKVPRRTMLNWELADIHLPERYNDPELHRNMVRALCMPPSILGFDRRIVLHPSLADHALLKRDAFALEDVDLDGWIQKLRPADIGGEKRTQFFDWLVNSRPRIGRDALLKVAQLAIWPSTREAFVPFEQLCSPRHATFRRVLQGYLHQPIPAVTAMKGVGTGRGILRLRTRPTATEIRSWYDEATGSHAVGHTCDCEHLRGVERDIAAMLRIKGYRPIIHEIAGDHLTLAQDGRLEPASELHFPSAVETLDLRKNTLLAPGYDKALMLLLGTRRNASAWAILDAIRHQPSDEKLGIRLVAFFRADDCDDVVGELKDTALFRGTDREIRARDTALVQVNQRDYWSSWREPIDVRGFSNKAREALLRLGAVGPGPSQESSQRFFRWLATRPSSELAQHLGAVLSHWGSSSGPQGWWRNEPNLGCLPVVRGKSEFRLFSWRRRNQALVPDYPALQRPVQERAHHWLVIPSLKDRVVGLIPAVRGDVPSLREKATPIDPPVVTDASDSIPELEILLEKLSSRKFATKLRKRLESDRVYEKPQRNWRANARKLSTVRLAGRVQQRYRVGRPRFDLDLPSAADLDRSTLWVTQTTAQTHSASFFQAVARVVFGFDAPPVCGWALQAALTSELQLDLDIDGARAARPRDDEPPAFPMEPGHSRHGEYRHDPDGEHPEPGPLEPSAGGLGEPNENASGRTRHQRRARSPRPSNAQEEKHGAELARSHYAHHCQVCLGESEPDVLAPGGSYVEEWESRAKLMFRHHVEGYAAGGERHGGNLILVCRKHHNLLGDHIAFNALADALARAAAVTKTYPRGPVSGLLAEVENSKGTIRIFFTPDHAKLWLGGSH